MFFFKKKSEKQSNIVPPQNQLAESVSVAPPTPTPKPKERHKVTGTNHHIDNILKLSSENLDFDLTKKELIDEGYENERIYQYDFYTIKTELVPEPDNPYDPNAIKVMIDGVLVGYIKAGSCSHILRLLNENRILKIESEIHGGKYKYLGYDEDEEKYFLEKGDSPYLVDLIITER